MDLNHSLAVRYAYTEMVNGVNQSRLLSITYPATFATLQTAHVVNYNYAAGTDDRISRPRAARDSVRGRRSLPVAWWCCPLSARRPGLGPGTPRG